MAGDVHAHIPSLEVLHTSIGQTLPVLDRFIAETYALAKQVRDNIEHKLYTYSLRLSKAYETYQQSLSDLEDAKTKYEEVPDFYYEAVEKDREEYSKALLSYSKLKGIRDEFIHQFSIIRRSMDQQAEGYNTVAKKGMSFLDKYIELLIRSNAALSGSSPVSSGNVGQDGSLKTFQSIDSIRSWLGDINPNYKNPFIPNWNNPYHINCGSCAFAVESRLNGDTTVVAHKENIGTDSGMERATGKKCVYMPVEKIEEKLKEQGAGSHMIVGINRKPTPWGQGQAGHWFNAYYDGKKIYTLDGQTGEVYDWPYDYGDISEWCALI